MAVNEVIYDGETLISLTSDTVTEDDLPEGVTAHDASGNIITGTRRYVRSVNNITPDDEGNVTLEKVDGKSAYEIWLEQGNTGTEEDFLESLKGKDGVSGVYVGSGDMPEGYNVQIDPDGNAEADLLAKVDEALAEAKTYTNTLADGAVATNTEDITDVRYEINEACKARFTSGTIVRLDDVKPCSNIELTWESGHQTLDFVVKGKNLLGTKYYPKDSGSFENTTGSWEIQEDGGIRLSGEIGNGEILNLGSFRFPAGTYTLSGLPDNCPADTSITFWIGGSLLASINASNEESRITTFYNDLGGSGFNCQIEFSETTTYDYTGVVIYPQIELGDSASSYENWQLEESFSGTTNGSSIPAFSPTTTVYEFDEIYFSVGTKIDLKPSITQYIQESADSVLAEAKTYTDEEIAKFDFIKVVDSLPNAGLPNRVYLVPKTDTQTQDLFDEYAWINKGTEESPQYIWEWFTTKQIEVDLTNYTTTTAVNNAIIARSKLEHPVGSIYISTKSTNPVNIFGFGTWVRIKDRFLLGVGDTYTEVSKTGGSATVALSTTQVPKVEGQIGIHGGATATNIHTTQGCFSAGITNTNKYINYGSGTAGADSIGQIRFSNGGTGAAHNNMPPYYTVYIWLRTA